MHRTRWGFGAAQLILLSALAAGIAPAQAQMPAASADAFVSSIGIGGGSPRTVEGDRIYREKAIPRIRELGVRTLRTDIDTHRPTSEAIYQELGRMGVKTLAIVDPRGAQWGTAHSPEQAVEFLKRVGPQYVIVEGPNEPDLINPDYLFTYNGHAITEQPSVIRDYMRDLYTAIKGDPATRNVTIVQASIGAAPRGGEDIWRYCDVIAAHWYGPGTAPGWGVDWKQARRQMRETGKPIWVSETGDHTAVYKTDGLWQPGVPEDVQAKNLARVPFYYWSQGIKRTFIHQLFSGDDPFFSQAQFGILRADYSPKPAFNALRDTIRLLQDPGPAFTPRPLRVTLGGETAGVMQVLLQKRDGRHYLVLWQNVSAFDPQSLAMRSNPTRRVTVSLAPGRGANVYAPTTNGRTPVAVHKSHRFAVDVPDHPLIVEVVSKPALLARATRSVRADVPGALRPTPPAGMTALRPLPGNLIVNYGFESGALQPWNDYGTQSKVSDDAPYAGTRAVRIGEQNGKGGVNIGVALSPNTRYVLRAQTRLSRPGEQARLSVMPTGMPQSDGHFAHTDWAPVTVEFTTGGDGSAQVYFWKDAGSGFASGDNFVLTTPDKLSAVEAALRAQEMRPVGTNATGGAPRR